MANGWMEPSRRWPVGVYDMDRALQEGNPDVLRQPTAGDVVIQGPKNKLLKKKFKAIEYDKVHELRTKCFLSRCHKCCQVMAHL